MNVIEQRILIPVPPDTIWNYISDFSNNPHWQADCHSISFLTTAHTGPNVRWRSASKQGHEYVVEVTAWYNRAGYEYRIVDGTPFKENLGRIRLQEVPEGTIVQWAFNYEPGGVFGGVRNAISTKRSVENSIVNSLWTLWRRITEAKASATSENYISKSLMRDAPDVEERSHYRPRHPSILVEAESPSNTSKEPAITDEDTKPHPVNAIPAEAKSISSEYVEPDFVRGIPREDADLAVSPAKFAIDSPEIADEQFRPPKDIETIRTAPSKSNVEEIPSPRVTEETALAPEVTTTPDLPRLSESNSDIDTSEVSVFDLFGVPKPGDVTTMRNVPASAVEEMTLTLIDDDPSTTEEFLSISQEIARLGGRAGGRIALRHRQANLRHPK